jgi:hypothetical protein
MGGQLKASLDVIVTCTVDSSVLVEAGPPVRSVELGALERNTATEERLFRELARTGEAAGPDGRTGGAE